MGYGLGIDVGTSYTAASVYRVGGENRADPDVVPLGVRSAAAASVVFLGADGQVVVGDGAERRALTDPDRVVREFKRRIGDDVPLLIGGEAHAAHDVAATVAAWVVQRAAEREGGPADRIVLTHPAAWGPHKKSLVADALVAAGVRGVSLLTEPEAAAISYAAQARVETGATIAVYDLGGGTFDAAIVRKSAAETFEVLGTPEGIDRLGGVDFDDSVFAHVRDSLGGAMADLDPSDPDVLAAVARLRRECTEAKEALSSDTDVTIPVLLPGLSTQVRLVRSEFEDMIRGPLEESVEALCRAMRSAGVTADDLDAVLLVGGSSRVPLVAQLVSAELGRPIAIDADPKTSIASGAALAAAPASSQAAGDGSTLFVVGQADRGAPADAPDRPAREAIVLDLPPADPIRRPRRHLKGLAAAGLLAVALTGAAALMPVALTESSPAEAGAATADATPMSLRGTAAADEKVSRASTSSTAGRGADPVDGADPTATAAAAPSAAAAAAGTSGGRGGGPAAPVTTTPGAPPAPPGPAGTPAPDSPPPIDSSTPVVPKDDGADTGGDTGTGDGTGTGTDTPVEPVPGDGTTDPADPADPDPADPEPSAPADTPPAVEDGAA